MRRWIVRLVLFVLAFLLAAGGYALRYVRQNVPVGTAYFAKILCSSVFVSGRAAADVLAADVALDNPLTPVLEVDVDRDRRQVSVSFLGFFERIAVFRGGLGCTLAIETTPEKLIAQARQSRIDEVLASGTEPAAEDALPWPDGDAAAKPPSQEVDAARLAAALDNAFSEPDPARPRRTRAVVVVHDDRLAAERYAPGFDRDTPLLGWSMTKSLTNALVGILVRQGHLDLASAVEVPEWTADGDPRSSVTLDQLLRMSSGLEFEEAYSTPQADVQKMLFLLPSAAAYAAAKPLRSDPDSEWYYSSGTSNIVSRIVRRAVEGAGGDYFSFPHSELFAKIKSRSFIIEPDPSGTFVGSSYSYASARDWARLGLLYLRDGVWNGERVLPEGWVVYSTTPTPRAPEGRYGAHFWLNAGTDAAGTGRPWPELPADAYFMSGFEGQMVAVVPSRNAVIVRLGLSRNPTSWDRTEFLAEVLATLP